MENIFNDAQKQAINHVMICMMAVDNDIDATEIQCWEDTKKHLHISPEDVQASVLMDLSDAIQILISMNMKQKLTALEFFINMMSSDGAIRPAEDELIKSIIAKFKIHSVDTL